MTKSIGYEIHVTVRTYDTHKFSDTCEKLKLKPIIIDLQKSDGSFGMREVMTSSKLKGSDEDAFEEVSRISRKLWQKGFKPVRQKIETVPWHKDAIVYDPLKAEENRYFETHVKTVIKLGSTKAAVLNTLCKAWGVHLSKSPFETLLDGQVVQMMTLREKIGLQSFTSKVHKFVEELERNEFPILKSPEIEFALFDSNITHDAAWLNS